MGYVGYLGTVTEGQKGDPRAPNMAQNSSMVAGKACPAPAGQPCAADNSLRGAGFPWSRS